MEIVVLKVVCMIVALMYGVSIAIKALYGHPIQAFLLFMFASGVSGVAALQWWI